jgi:hypothetical protein
LIGAIFIGAEAAIKVGIFGMVLVGLCSLLLGIMIRLFSLDPIVYFAAMAGVLFPAVTVAAGMLALWASESPLDLPQGGVKRRISSSLTAGIVTVFGGALVWLLSLALTLKDVFPISMLSAATASPGLSIFIEISVLIAAYIALSVIGGVLYCIVVPGEKTPRF